MKKICDEFRNNNLKMKIFQKLKNSIQKKEENINFSIGREILIQKNGKLKKKIIILKKNNVNSQKSLEYLKFYIKNLIKMNKLSYKIKESLLRNENSIDNIFKSKVFRILKKNLNIKKLKSKLQIFIEVKTKKKVFGYLFEKNKRNYLNSQQFHKGNLILKSFLILKRKINLNEKKAINYFLLKFLVQWKIYHEKNSDNWKAIREELKFFNQKLMNLTFCQWKILTNKNKFFRKFKNKVLKKRIFNVWKIKFNKRKLLRKTIDIILPNNVSQEEESKVKKNDSEFLILSKFLIK